MAKIKKILSRNNDFQHIEVIKRNRYKRHKYREFFIEGVRNINAALENGWEIESFIFSDSAELSIWAKKILRTSNAKYHFRMADELLKEISDKENTSEILAVAKVKNLDIENIPIKDDLLVVIFDRPLNPGNLGTVIRSCESFNVDALIITGHSADLYAPTTIRASVGSFFYLPAYILESHDGISPFLNRLKENEIDFQIVGTSAKSETIVRNVSFEKATILIIGNETTGMSNNYKELCDFIVRIPIHGNASSLNVGCATSIILYEIDSRKISGNQDSCTTV